MQPSYDTLEVDHCGCAASVKKIPVKGDRDHSSQHLSEHLLLSAASPDFCQKVVLKGAKRWQWAELRTLSLQSSDDEPVCSCLIARWVSAS